MHFLIIQHLQTRANITRKTFFHTNIRAEKIRTADPRVRQVSSCQACWH